MGLTDEEENIAVSTKSTTIVSELSRKSNISPMVSPRVDPEERQGLTTEQVEALYEKWGFNELPVIHIPLWKVFLQQFMGTMPYMLELAIIISAAVQDFADLGIILAMVCCDFINFICQNLVLFHIILVNQ
jgi:magnesium-transporting ATPase (P-type)